MLNIDKILKSEELYNTTFNTYYQDVLDDFANRKNVVTVQIGKKKYDMKLSKLLINLIMWRPFLEFKVPFSTDFILDTDSLNADQLASYIDIIIEIFLDEDNQDRLNDTIAYMVENLGLFSNDFNPIIGNTINLRDKIQLAKRNERYSQLIRRKFEAGMTTDEIEKALIADTKELKQILATEENCFQDFINAKEGVNEGQLTQFEINIGPKPDLKGRVFPKIINTNFLVDGLQSVSDYYLDGCSGRKAI